MTIISSAVKRSIPGIYPILDAQWLNAKDSFSPAKIKQVAVAIAAADISVLQLRCKATGLAAYEFIDTWLPTLREHCKNTAIIINDRVDLALYFEADGVHVGQDDLPPHLCRKLLGAKSIIGLSTHSLTEIRNATDTTVDYIGFGPIFPTTSKTDTKAIQGVKALAAAQKATSLPIVAIGGIGIEQIPEIKKTKTAAAAMISGLWDEQIEPQFNTATSIWLNN
ncbi:MAG: thiamine phosphate synthase [Magnetococcales bacterium]|nr:thiamine phosphate synthase [Magnetococcales bacterium]